MKNWFDLLPKGRAFIKMQGLQNHFVIVDGRSSPFSPAKSEIQNICDLSSGVGAEQLLVLEPCSSVASGAYARIRIYNTDGAETEACGNAARCVALLLMREADLQQMSLEVAGRILFCKMEGKHISVAMGNVVMDWDQIPLSAEKDTLYFQPDDCPQINAVALNIGNPHVVVFVDKAEQINMPFLGQEIQKSASLPRSANVGFAQIINNSLIKLQVWERPGILTKACGSGACVAAFASIKRGLLQTEIVHVDMPGGRLTVNCTDLNNLILSGPAEYCFSGYLTI